MGLGRLIAIAAALISCRGGFDRDPAADASPDVAAPDGPAVDAALLQCGNKDVTPIGTGGAALGTTANESNDFFSSCGGVMGNEAVFSIEIEPAVEDLAINVTDASFGPSLFARADCTASPAGELGCDDDGSLFIEDLEPGTLFIFVDSRDASSGTFSLGTIKLDRRNSSCNPADPARRCNVENECVSGTCVAASCEGALERTDAFTDTGTTAGASSLHGGSCAGGGVLAPEVVYEITLSVAVSDLMAATNFPGTSYDTLLYLRTACDGTEIACNDDIASGMNRSILNSGPLAAGTYFLFVDGFGTSDGDFELAVTLTP